MKRLFRWTAWLIPAAIALFLYGFLPAHPALTEAVFSRGIFRGLSAVLGTVVGWLPFSLTELCAVLALPAVILLVVLLVRKLKRSPRKLRVLAVTGRRIGAVLSCLLLLYMLMHGANFYRLPLSEQLGLDTSKKDAAFLQAVCLDLAAHMTEERALLQEDADGCAVLSQTVAETLQMADENYAALAETYPVLQTFVKHPKPVMLSHYWSYTGITGMYFPLLCESNINVDVPAFSIPATVAHELGHTCGFAREEDCNFLAFLTCIGSESPDYRYSGYMLAYIYCGNALYDYDKELWKETRALLSDGVKRDMSRRNAYWKQFETPVKTTSTAVNDAFLSSQGESDGVLSYNRVVGLILGYYAKEESPS